MEIIQTNYLMFAGYRDNKNHECVKGTHSNHSFTMTKYLKLNFEETSEIENNRKSKLALAK